MKVHKRGIAAGLALAIAASAAPLVLADVKTISDPRDSRGKLDVVEAEARHMPRVPGFVKHVITFEDRNGPPDGVSIGFRFRVAGKGVRRRTIFVDVNRDGGLYGEMHRPGVAVGYVRAWRPDARSIAVAFPTSLLSRGIEQYRWGVLTDYIDGDANCADTDVVGNCIDRAPDEGWAIHRL